MDDYNKDAAEYLIKTLETQGVACSTVKDGHVLMFKRSVLQGLLDGHPDKNEFVIFVKRPDFDN
jgi:hypothetical protein